MSLLVLLLALCSLLHSSVVVRGRKKVIDGEGQEVGKAFFNHAIDTRKAKAMLAGRDEGGIVEYATADWASCEDSNPLQGRGGDTCRQRRRRHYVWELLAPFVVINRDGFL